MKTFKVRLKPNKTQEEFFWKQCRLNRNLYNEVLSFFKLKPSGKFSVLETHLEMDGWSHFTLCRYVTPLRDKKSGRFRELYSDSANITMKELSAAIQEFFKRCKKGEGSELSYRNCRDNNSFSFCNNHPKKAFDNIVRNGKLKVPTLKIKGVKNVGLIKISDRGNFTSKINGVIKQVKIVREGNYWFACLVVDKFVEVRRSKMGAVGIDLGVSKPVVTSKGDIKELPVEKMKYWQKRLKFYQKKLAKQQGGKGVQSSNRREKTKRHIQRCHKNLRNLREDFHHKVSHELTLDNHIICIEDLNVKGMTKSAKGTSENHGENVKTKSNLNRSILNVGFYGLVEKIKYKSEFRGGQCVLVEPSYTSQECSSCGHVHSDNRKTQSGFECVKCGHKENADLNASKNILKKGLTQIEKNA